MLPKLSKCGADLRKSCGRDRTVDFSFFFLFFPFSYGLVIFGGYINISRMLERKKGISYNVAGVHSIVDMDV